MNLEIFATSPDLELVGNPISQRGNGSQVSSGGFDWPTSDEPDGSLAPGLLLPATPQGKAKYSRTSFVPPLHLGTLRARARSKLRRLAQGSGSSDPVRGEQRPRVVSRRSAALPLAPPFLWAHWTGIYWVPLGALGAVVKKIDKISTLWTVRSSVCVWRGRQ